MSVRVLEETRVVPMPAVAGWTEAGRLAHMARIRESVAEAGAVIVKERRFRNAAFDRSGERSSWEFVVRYPEISA